ncbi:hypothetical protein AUP68_03639 [Ilyonectria robusta]
MPAVINGARYKPQNWDIIRLGSLFFSATTVAAASSRTIDMRLITYNIRLAVRVGGPGEELWSIRRLLITS